MKTGLVYRGETRILDDEARRTAPGSFIGLPNGMVHYELKGPPDGRLVVLVHGFSVPYYIWDPTFSALVTAGSRVLRYDLFGRGYSDRPDLPYTMELFVRQLKDLLEALQVDLPIDLLGLSMGGPISAGFTDRYPERVRKLGLLDPAGFQSGRPVLYRLVSLPGLGEVLIGLLPKILLASNQPGDSYLPEKLPGYPGQFLPQMQYPGFKRAILSTLRVGPLGELTETYRRVAATRRPVLLIWGKQDKVVPFKLNEKARQIMPQAEFHAIDQAGHIAHYERAEVVNPLLIAFLKT
jgi:pimeloyl-ACP methyl ester carboxylesterase